MGWIKKLFLNRKEKELVNKLIIIATAENLVDSSEILILKEKMNYLTMDALDKSVDEVKTSLPKSAKERFSLIYFMTSTLMSNGALPEQKQNIITKLIMLMNLSRDRALELVSFLKLNIRNGLSEEDSYQRLGYLVG